MLTRLNTHRHRQALTVLTVIVLVYWAVRLLRAAQIHLFHIPAPQAHGLLGVPFPWLVHSEWSHHGYSLIVLIGFLALLPGFTGPARTWWLLALGVQLWCQAEHLTGSGVELDLFHDVVVLAPAAVAMRLHRRPSGAEPRELHCTCADRTEAAA